jgi:hypothetical protein
MISKPTTPQLIGAACAELETKVAPAIADGTTRVVLEMVVAVLKGAAVRSANELAWMRDEAEAIEELARRLVAELPDAAALVAALEAYTGGKTDSRYLAEAEADYERASEVLSCAAEAAFAHGDPEHISAVRRLLDQRMANETAVIGQYVGVGRG